MKAFLDKVVTGFAYGLGGATAFDIIGWICGHVADFINHAGGR